MTGDNQTIFLKDTSKQRLRLKLIFLQLLFSEVVRINWHDMTLMLNKPQASNEWQNKKNAAQNWLYKYKVSCQRVTINYCHFCTEIA